MRKVFKNIRSTLAAILTFLVIFGIGYWAGSVFGLPSGTFVGFGEGWRLPWEQERRVITEKDVQEKLLEIKEFSTYCAEYEIDESTENSRYIGNWIKIWGTTNRIKIQCKGVVKVGYDLTQVEINVNNAAKTIQISLPPVQVHDNYIIWDSMTITEQNSILNPIDSDQYELLVAEIEKEGLEMAEKDGIYQNAEENMKQIITSIMEGLEYKVVFVAHSET